MKLKILGILPARLDSTRLPKKMLDPISGKPLIYWSWKQAMKAKLPDQILIATDSKIIFDIVKSFGARVVMTPQNINCGSDRVAYAAKHFKDFKPSIVVNIQGDEPLMPPSAIDKSIKALITDKSAVVSTPATPFKNKKDLESPNFVKVVLDKNNHALLFSRSVLPFPRDPYDKYLKHLGLYAYRADFLEKYTKWKQTPLEKAEKLEQLRIMENGYKISVVVDSFPNMEVNTKEELNRARRMITKK